MCFSETTRETLMLECLRWTPTCLKVSRPGTASLRILLITYLTYYCTTATRHNQISGISSTILAKYFKVVHWWRTDHPSNGAGKRNKHQLWSKGTWRSLVFSSSKGNSETSAGGDSTGIINLLSVFVENWEHYATVAAARFYVATALPSFSRVYRTDYKTEVTIICIFQHEFMRGNYGWHRQSWGFGSSL